MDKNNIMTVSDYGNISNDATNKASDLADTMYYKILFLRDIFETLNTNVHDDLTFSPYFFAGLSNIIKDISINTEELIEFIILLKKSND